MISPIPQTNLYSSLREILKPDSLATKPTLYLIDEKGKHPEPLLGRLGGGKCKHAVLVSKGRALLLPRIESDDIDGVATRWGRMVEEEVKMSQLLTRLGLLSPLSKEVKISLTETAEQTLPAYISPTFESLGTEGCFIIDDLTNRASTWKGPRKNQSLLPSKGEDSREWDPAFIPLVKDLATIAAHHLPLERDSWNLAIVKNPSPSSACPYEARFFGFDFSSRASPLSEITGKATPPPDLIKGLSMLKWALDKLLRIEFGTHSQNDDKVTVLHSSLFDRYAPLLAKKANELIQGQAEHSSQKPQ